MRINFEFTEDQVKELKALQQKTGSTSMKDMFNSAMSMLEWSVDEKIKGHEIASVDPDSQNFRVLVMPILQKAAKQKQKSAPSTDSELVLV
ncbi:MAG TPA: hypothetical protein VFC39_12340 [Acidobacteriaceae bacterium]|nr:hypothetical protein [Acidobacteriaceae bacterium]